MGKPSSGKIVTHECNKTCFSPFFGEACACGTPHRTLGACKGKGYVSGIQEKIPKASGLSGQPFLASQLTPFRSLLGSLWGGQAFGAGFLGRTGRSPKSFPTSRLSIPGFRPDPGLVILNSASDFSRLLPALVTVYMHRPQLDLSHPRSGNSAMWRYR